MDNRGFWYSSGMTYAGTIASVLFMIAFYVSSLRIGTASFGVLQSTTALLFALFACRGVAGSFVVIHAVGKGEPLPAVARQGVKLALMMGCCVLGLLLLLAPVLRDFLHMDTSLPFVLIGLSAVPSFLAGIMDGILNAQRRFAALAISTPIVPAMNLLLSLALFRDGFQHADGGWLVLGSQSISLVNAAFVDWRSALGGPPAKRDLSYAEAGMLLVASLLFGACLRFDVFWARHTLGENAAGSYAIAAAIAVVLYLISGNVGRVTSVALRGGANPRIVYWSHAMIIGVSTVLGAGFFAVGERALLLVAGKTIDVEWNVLLPLFLSVACYSIIFFDYSCLNVFTKRVHVGIAFILVCAQVAAVVTFGTSAASIAWAQCAVMVALMIAFSAVLARTVAGRSAPFDPHPAERHLVHQG